MRRPGFDREPLLADADAILKRVVDPFLTAHPSPLDARLSSDRISELLAQARLPGLEFTRRRELLAEAVALGLIARGRASLNEITLIPPPDDGMAYPIGALSWACASQAERERQADMALALYAAFWFVAARTRELGGLVRATLPFYLGLARRLAGQPLLPPRRDEDLESYIARIADRSSPTIESQLFRLIGLLLSLHPREGRRAMNILRTVQGSSADKEDDRPTRAEESRSIGTGAVSPQDVRAWSIRVFRLLWNDRQGMSSSDDAAGLVAAITEAAASGTYAPLDAFQLLALARAVQEAQDEPIPSLGQQEQLLAAASEAVQTEFQTRYERVRSLTPAVVLEELDARFRDREIDSAVDPLDLIYAAERKVAASSYATADAHDDAARKLLDALALSVAASRGEREWREVAARFASARCKQWFLIQTAEGFASARAYGLAAVILAGPNARAETGDPLWSRPLRLTLSTRWREDSARAKIKVDGTTPVSVLLLRIEESRDETLWRAVAADLRAVARDAPWLPGALRKEALSRPHIFGDDPAHVGRKEAADRVLELLSSLTDPSSGNRG